MRSLRRLRLVTCMQGMVSKHRLIASFRPCFWCRMLGGAFDKKCASSKQDPPRKKTMTKINLSLRGLFLLYGAKRFGSLTRSAMAPVATWVGIVGGVFMAFTMTFCEPMVNDCDGRCGRTQFSSGVFGGCRGDWTHHQGDGDVLRPVVVVLDDLSVVQTDA